MEIPMHRLSMTLALAAAVGGCTSSPAPTTLGDPPAADAPAAPPAPAAPAFGAGDGGPAVVLAGPAHGCTKIRYSALGALLASLGVTMDPTVPGSAAALYANGADALGTARYAERVREGLLG